MGNFFSYPHFLLDKLTVNVSVFRIQNDTTRKAILRQNLSFSLSKIIVIHSDAFRLDAAMGRRALVAGLCSKGFGTKATPSWHDQCDCRTTY